MQTHTRETHPFYPGWPVLVAAVIGMAFSPGPMIFASLGLFAPYLTRDFGWSLGQVMLMLTVLNIAGVLAAPLTGKLLDRFGVRAVLFPSLVFLAAGFAALALMPSGSLIVYYVIAFAWGALTVGSQSITYTKLITTWFVRHRGLAVGLVAAGLGVGYSLVPLIVAQALKYLSWQQTYLFLGALVLVVPFLVNLVLARPRAEQAAADAGVPVTHEGLTLKEAQKTPEFYYMALAILLASAALTGVVPHIALFTRDHGFDVSAAAIVGSTYGLSTIIGRVLVGALADRFFVPWVAIGFFLLSVAGFLCAGLIGASPSLGVLIFIAMAIGLGFGAESDIIALLIVRYFGQKNFGAIYGYLLSAFLIGASAGPPLFGFARDAAGSYTLPMIVASVVMLSACVLLGRLPRRRETVQQPL